MTKLFWIEFSCFPSKKRVNISDEMQMLDAGQSGGQGQFGGGQAPAAPRANNPQKNNQGQNQGDGGFQQNNQGQQNPPQNQPQNNQQSSQQAPAFDDDIPF